ncbi:PREDICTED: uncharacterized protein LOC108361851 isoform X1 [Rhagoletis zephyria]|uniref:uncharacterized protein LOC108361851 isoform X1 n=1 Tax=Rhagoletis zephyria TaxID=28612 RepID=UPI000811347D|nr:PREDICTED: uncharacterized protein LOC108361851 isoform X1 [Rhagoletis zephyria]XP_017470110.1 PREDICTED: uncharacterized protein LOC108361851 isoform X1 [Rhagoletis zephyria]
MAAIKTEMPPLHAADAGGGGGGGTGGNSGGGGSECGGNADTIVSNSPHSNSSGVGDAGLPGTNSGNNTISAAADSSDNQPGTPQPPINGQLIGNNEQQQQQLAHNPYGMYTSVATTTHANASLAHMYGGGGGIYATAGAQSDMQQQQGVGAYPSYINSFEQFYQQQQQQVGSATTDYGLMYATGPGGNSTSSDYKAGSNSSSASGVRYHPYLNTPTSCGPNDAHGNGGNRNGTPDIASSGGGGGTLPLPQSSAAVSTTTNSLSPRVVSSSSPTSTSAHLQLSGSSAAGSPAGGCKLQCKKCGLMCTSDNELQEHITNVHGASPYGSSGYSSSPYIKEELSSGSQQQSTGQQGQGGNPGELLDLDSQKMVYPPAPGSIPAMLHHPQQMHDVVGASDPLHSMHSMQQRALPGWEQPQPPNGGMQEGLPPYMQQQPPTQPSQPQTDLSGKPPHANQSPYYSPKQSPYHVTGGGPNGMNIKQEYGLIKSEYPDSQNYVDKSFDPTVAGDMCQQPPPSVQQQQMMPVSSSPAEFPSTTTGSQDAQQQYRGFEPPSSSSVNSASAPTKAATWKSNEARRPKTYNCTACNKWFTSSGHLKRHYNTTLHKNAVKSSGQPDPATLPISAHHHPAREPTTTTKSHSRRNNANAAAAAAAAAAQQQQPPAPVQPPEPPRSPPDFGQGAGMGQLSQYSASPSPTQQAQLNGMPYSANPSGYQPQQQQYLNQVQSSTNSHSPQNVTGHMNVAGSSPNNTQTVLNGHPNGLAGPSAQTTPQPMPSSQTRGLLNTTTTTIITKSEPMEDNNYHHNSSNNNMSLTHSAQLEAPESDTDQDTMSEERERSQTDMEILQQQQHQQLEEEAAAAAAVAAEQAQEAEAQLQRHRQAQADLEREEHLGVFHHHQLLEELAEQQRHFHNSTPTLNPESGRVPSPHITSHQQYQEQLRRPQAMVDSIFSAMQPPAGVHMPANIMDQQYNIIPLGINTPPLLSSSMQLLQPPQPITTSTATTVNMGNIHMLHNHHTHHHTQHTQQAAQAQQEQLVLPSMRNTLLNNTSIQSQLDTINTTTTPQLLPPITTTTQQLLPPPQLQQPLHTTNTIPSFQQLQQGSELAPLEPTMTYHTIIGNGTMNGEGFNANSSGSSDVSSEFLQLASLDPYGGLQTQQMITSDGQIVQFMSSALMGQTFYALPPRTTIREAYPRSPQEGDLPPAHTILPNGLSEQDKLHSHQESTQTMIETLPSAVEPYPHEEEEVNIKSYAHAEDEKQNIKPDTTVMQELVDSTTGKPNDCSIITVSTANTNANTNTVSTTTSTTASTAKPKRAAQRQPPSKRRRSPSSCTTTPRSTMLPSGRIKCLECNKEFTKNCYLTQHNKSFHSGEYPYRCIKCGKRYQYPEVYEVHISRHKASEKPHKCELCPKQFHHKTDLRRHVEAIHTGMKQHVCDICEKSFCRRDHLRKHIETHKRPKVIAKRVLKDMTEQGILDMETLKAVQPMTKPSMKMADKYVRLDKDQSKDSHKKQQQAVEEGEENVSHNMRERLTNIKQELLDMPPPMYASQTQNLTITAVTMPLDCSDYQRSGDLATDDSFIEDDDNVPEGYLIRVIKQEENVQGMPEKQLSAYF